VSSAHGVISQCSNWSGKSFIYTVNSSGPRIEPCGTPIGTIAWSDLLLLQTVTWLRLKRYDSNHLEAIESSNTLKLFNLDNSMEGILNQRCRLNGVWNVVRRLEWLSNSIWSKGKIFFLLISRSCLISEEAIKIFPVNFNQSGKRTNEMNEAILWYNYDKRLKKYTDKSSSWLNLWQKVLKGKKCLKWWNVYREPKHLMKIHWRPLKWTKRKPSIVG